MKNAYRYIVSPPTSADRSFQLLYLRSRHMITPLLIAHGSVSKNQLICSIIVPVWAGSLDWKIYSKNETGDHTWFVNIMDDNIVNIDIYSEYQ